MGDKEFTLELGEVWMINGDKVTFKCPHCDFQDVFVAEELAIKAYEHYRKEHVEHSKVY